MMCAVDRAKVKTIRAAVGWAASEAGDGVAYALLGGPGNRDEIVRVTFRCSPLAALRGRDVGYAALNAVAAELHERGIQRLRFAVEDQRLVADLTDRLPVPAPLAIPYITLGCALNRFRAAAVVATGEPAVRDLSARARAEVFLRAAA